MGRYPGKAGMTMLLHLIIKVSRLLQPAVIVVEDVDRLFMKKSGRSERWDMRRLRKELPKILRAIEPEFRVLLIGTTCNAWDCDQRVNKSMSGSLLQSMICLIVSLFLFCTEFVHLFSTHDW